MKTILATFLSVLLLLPVSALGEIQTVTHTVKQPFGGSQSPDDARIAAVAKAKREALELAGTYIESTTVVKDAQVERDEILALTAGILKAEVVSQKNYTTDDAFGIEVTVRVEVDTAVLEARLKKLLADKPHLEQLKQARAREKELLEKIASLERENRKLGQSDQFKANLEKEFKNASQRLTASGLILKSLGLWVGDADGKFSDPQKAVEYLSEAIRLQPDYVSGYYFRGLTYCHLRQYQLAIKDFDKVLQLKPDDAEIYHQRGYSYQKLGQDQRAIKDYNEAIRLKPDYVPAYALRGSAYLELKQYQQAIKDFDEAIRLEPNNAALCYDMRGFAYLRSGNSEEGCRSFQKACELGNCSVYESMKQDGSCQELTSNRLSAIVWLGKGEVFQKEQKFQEAIEAFTKAVELDPKLAKAYSLRGFIYDQLRDYAKANMDYERAIELDPKDKTPYSNRAITSFHILKNYRQSINDLNKVIELDPKNLFSYLLRSTAYHHLKNYDQAIKDCDKIIELNPKGANRNFLLSSAHSGRGDAYMSLANHKRAIEDFDRAIELYPKNINAYESRGVAYGNLLDYKRAIEDFDRVIEIGPINGNVYYLRGFAHAVMEDQMAAIEDFKTAAKLNVKRAQDYLRSKGIKWY